MNVYGGQLIQQPLNPALPGTSVSGPLLAGSIMAWDGTQNLAGLGSTAGGLANVGYAKMAQAGRITQAASPGAPAGTFVSPDLVIPAQSMILSITMVEVAPWSGAATTFGIGNTVSATAYTPAGAVAGANSTTTPISSEVGATALNWLNVGNQDVQLVFTSTNTGTGVGIAVVEYIQGLNAPTS